MKTLALLAQLLVCITASAQFGSPFDLTFLNQPLAIPLPPTPTNLAGGATAIAWYIGTDVTTNAGVWTLADRVSGLNLTNKDVGAKWPIQTSTNTIWFNGAAGTRVVYGRNEAYTNWSPCEVVLVVQPVTSSFTTNNILVDSANASFDKSIRANPTGSKWRMYDINASLDGAEILFGQWAVIYATFNSTNLVIYTNKVQGLSIATSDNNVSGITMGARENFSTSYCGTWLLAEAVFYRGTNTTTARAILYDYFKTNSAVCKNLGLP